MAHFENLNHAHEAILKAKAQIDRLAPLVSDCDQHAALAAEIENLRGCRDALRPFFAGLKASLIERQIDGLKRDMARVAELIATLQGVEKSERLQRDDIKRAIFENGGDRIEYLKKEMGDKQTAKDERFARANQYERLAREVNLPGVSEVDTFIANRHTIVVEQETLDSQRAGFQNTHTERSVAFSDLKRRHDEIRREIDSLRNRKSNMPSWILAIREELCKALQLTDTELPFIGELVEVRPEEQAWEGAAERLLHNYALSILVPDQHYGAVAGWVEQTHLGNRLVYYRVRERRPASLSGLHPQSLARKLAIKSDSSFYGWIEADLAQRYDHVCCETLDAFRREAKALTRSGQIKAGGERHEKDDRFRLVRPHPLCAGLVEQGQGVGVRAASQRLPGADESHRR